MFTAGFFSLLLDTLIAVLLCVTIAYCWILNQRIKVLQDGKGELAKLLKHFDESTKRASDSIIALQTTSKRIGESIQFRIEKSNYLIEDLAYMIEKGEKMASRLDASFAVNRARGRVMAEEAPRSMMKSTLNPAVKVAAKPVEKAPVERPAEKAEVRYHHREDAEDTFPRPETNGDRPMQSQSLAQSAQDAAPMLRQKKLSSLEAMLEKVTARAKLPTMEDDEDERFPPQRPVSSPNWPKVPASASINPPAENGNLGAARPVVRQRSKAEQELLDMLKTGIKG